VIVNELFGRFDGGGVVRMIVQEFDYNGIEMPVDADAVGAIIWDGAAPFGGSAILSVTDKSRRRGGDNSTKFSL
jgi:hypothetical protein